MPTGVYDHYKIRKVSRTENWDQYRDLEYYTNHFCHCPCHGRIKVKSYHRWTGIPKYIKGHNRRGTYHSKETKTKQSETKLGGRNPAKRSEVRTKIKTSIDKYWENPDHREKHGFVMKEVHNRPEVVANHRAAARKTWQDPEYRENHSNYKGGSFLSQCHPNFTEFFREKIRTRDNYSCQLCDKVEEVLGRALSVHHVYYDSETNDCSNDSDFITLCASCHMKTNYNRKYWTEFFQLVQGKRFCSAIAV